MSDITVNITTISTSVNVTDNEVSVAVSFIPVDVTLNFEYGVSRAVIDSLLTKENITGLKETDSPEFSSLQSKALQSATNGGQIPDTDYSWFKGLFAGLQDKFIFSWIYGLITLVKDALTRVGLLEDNSYLDRFKVPTKHLVSGDYFNSARTASSANLTSALQMDKLIMIPFSVSDNITIDSAMLRVYTGIASTKIRIGIYEGSPFYPYGLIWASSEIATDTAGVKSSSIPNLVLQKNKMYWFAYIANSSEPRIYNYQTYQTAIIKAANAQAGYNELYIYMNYGEIPSNLDGLTMNDFYTYFPIISLKKA